jgi:hypothetical protein
MPKNATTSGPERRPAPPQSPARKSVLILTAVIGLGAVALVVVASKHRKPGDHAANPGAESAQVPESSEASKVAPEPVSPSPAPSAVTTAPSNPDPAAVARQLIKSLSEVKMQSGDITPEKAEKWHRNLEELIETGTAAVPPLQEFFQGHVDVRFDSGPGTNLLGEPSLRIAFMKVLFDIPSPDNVNLQEQVLRNTTDPGEVDLLARQLELQEPGTYRDLIVLTARVSLEQARTGQWPGRDTGPLVKILNQYGEGAAK